MPHGRQRGIALISVLWAVVLLSALAASLLVASRTELRLGRNAAGQAQARALAEAGVNRAILGLLERQPDQRWRGDGTLYHLSLPGGAVRIVIQDEAGRIDLNKAGVGLLRPLLRTAGLDEAEAEALADAIRDWRDPDQLRRLHGAEDDDYRAAGYTYGAADRPFAAVEELQQVIGMSSALYRRIAPAVTVFSGQGNVDATVAPRAVLAALPNMTEAEIDAVMAARAGRTAPAPFRPGGAVFTVYAEARGENGSVYLREAIVRITRDPARPYLIHGWKQGDASFFAAIARDGATAEARSDRP
jgi:general secretion pathway protein K